MAEIGLAASIIAVIQLTGAVTSFSYGYISGVKRAPKDLGELVNELGSLSKVLVELQNLVDKPQGPGQPQLTTLQTLDSKDGPLEGVAAELKVLLAKLEPKKGLRKKIQNLKWPLKETETMQHIARIERHKNLFVFALTADQISLSTAIGEHLQDTKRMVQGIQLLAQNTNSTVQDITRLTQNSNLTIQDVEKLVQNSNLTLHDLQKLTQETNISARRIESFVQGASITAEDTQKLTQNTSLTLSDLDKLTKSTAVTTNDIKELVQNSNLTVCNTQGLAQKTDLTTEDIRKLTLDTSSTVQSIEAHISHTNCAIGDLQAGSEAQGSWQRKEEIIRNMEKRKKALDWISLDDFESKHLEIRRKRQHNTGGWILRAPQFSGWVGGRRKNRCLWGYGIPGAGKTVLSSLVIDHLQDQAKYENYGVAYIYFDYKNQQTLVNILAGLVKQLAYQIANLPAELEDLYSKRGHEGKRPTVEELYAALLRNVNSFAKVFLVFDAVDEYNQEDLDQRGELLGLFRRVGEHGINIFLTSRPHPEDIQNSLRDAARIEILANKDDIRVYIQEKFNKNPRVKRLVMQSKLYDRTVSELTDCAQGMFLLVQFHVEYLCKQVTKAQISTALDSLKNSSREEWPLDYIYNRAIKDVRKQNPELALRVLSWLVKARRTLTVDEVRIAVSIEPDQRKVDEDNLLDRATILDICAGLVTVDENNMTVRLVHYTVHDYLLKTCVIFQDVDFRVAMACATYLSFDVFAKGACQSNDSLKARRHSQKFLDYAASQLSAHIESCDKSLSADTVLKFVRNPGNISSYLQVIHSPENPRGTSDYDIYPKGRHAIHVAAALGHRTVIEKLLDYDASVSVLDSQRQTALHIAASEGNEEVARLLLDKGVDISLPNYHGQTALHMAASKGQKAVIMLLVQRGAHLSARDSLGYTALHNAAFEKHMEVIQLLIDSGAGLSATTNNGRTALHTAVYLGNEAVAQLLLKNGIDTSAEENNGRTVLDLAISRKNETMLRLLLQNNNRILGANKRTLLHLAVLNRNRLIVQSLLENGCDHSIPDNDGRTALHLAVLNGDQSITQLLLENGLDHTIADNEGRTALHLAAQNGDQSTTQLFLENGLNHTIVDNDGRTALHLAVLNGDKPTIQLLLGNGLDHTTLRPRIEEGPDLLYREVYWRMILGGLALKRQMGIAKLLLEKGVGFPSRGFNSRTALHKAALRKYEQFTEILLEHEADPLVLDPNQYTALRLAGLWGNEATTRALFRHRMGPRAPLEHRVEDPLEPNRAALRLAGFGGNEAAARALRRHRMNFRVPLRRRVAAPLEPNRVVLRLAGFGGNEAAARALRRHRMNFRVPLRRRVAAPLEPNRVVLRLAGFWGNEVANQALHRRIRNLCVCCIFIAPLFSSLFLVWLEAVIYLAI